MTRRIRLGHRQTGVLLALLDGPAQDIQEVAERIAFADGEDGVTDGLYKSTLGAVNTLARRYKLVARHSRTGFGVRTELTDRGRVTARKLKDAYP